MKTILLIIVLCSVVFESRALKKEFNHTKAHILSDIEEKRNLLKQRMNRQGAIQLPFEYPTIRKDNKKIYGLNGLEITTCIPPYVYKDLGRKVIRSPKGNLSSINYSLIRHFDIKKKNFALIYLGLRSVPGEFRHLLVTLDENHQIIDTLEVAIGGRHEDGIITKQYRLNTDLSLTVYDLQPTSDKIQRYQIDQFDSFDARRVDTHYQINDEGKFVKGEEIRFKPQTYTTEELYQKSVHGIWNGTEIPVDTP